MNFCFEKKMNSVHVFVSKSNDDIVNICIENIHPYKIIDPDIL
ncbi:hypothetical protein CLV48_11222 [Cecembia rubra]|uniref:Uncharacterized protein n=1 Tax=Cecembia rubra TaxID=1485585 RepID=A0A2P8DWS6_9BACT|nr:hypothetical protein CLV48_11222 [Cecembia rubra]